MLAATGLAAAFAPAAANEIEGRLFFRPDERALLDEARRRPERLPPPPPEPSAGVAAPPPPPPPPVTLDGVVRRSDGTATVWLNGKPAPGGKALGPVEVLPPGPASAAGRVTLRVPETGRRVDLGVGQQFDVTSGAVRERYRMQPPPDPAPAAENEEARPAPVRRPARERELLRDLLRELDPAPAARNTEAPPAAAPQSARPD